MEADNRWMSDPALKGIDKSKLTFLEKLFIQSQKVNFADKKEMMSFMLTLTKFSKENNISFEKNEVELIYSIACLRGCVFNMFIASRCTCCRC